MRSLFKRPIVLGLAIVALVAIAAAPALQTSANDGKARAIASGDLDLAQLETQAEANAAALPTPGAECSGGFAGPYPCENVDLLSIVPTVEIGAATGADVWGWTDPDTGREIAIPTTTFGAAFVDVTDPSSPQVLGRAFIGAEDSNVLWRDVKVYDDHAYVVSEHSDTHLQIFDLHRFDDVDEDQGVIEPDAVYDGFGGAHNIAINTETGFAYILAGDTCAAGMDILDLSDPTAPASVGCVNDETLGLEEGTFDAVHDAQCVIYQGPDAQYRGSEICFTANEERGVFIVDVSDKSNPVLLTQRQYDQIAYAHQGWLTDDHRYWVFGDELDELNNGVPTRTMTYDVSNLENPGDVKIFEHATNAIDHNIYLEDGLVWEANYSAGLRVLDYTAESIAEGQYEQVGFFDVDPGEDGPVFAGAWTAYPFFDSGTIALNSFDSGLFLLRFTPPEEDTSDGSADDSSGGGGDDTTDPSTDVEDDSSDMPATGGGAAAAVGGLLLLGGAVGLRRFLSRG